MRDLLLKHPLAAAAVYIASGLSALLGAMVLFGWHTQNTDLIQVNPAFVPMQYITALGFLACGAGLGLLIVALVAVSAAVIWRFATSAA